MDVRPRQPAAVDDAGVIQGVAEHGVAAADQGRNGADVGRIAGRKQQRRLGLFESRQTALQFIVALGVSYNQRAGAGAEAFPLRGPTGCVGQARVAGQP